MSKLDHISGTKLDTDDLDTISGGYGYGGWSCYTPRYCPPTPRQHCAPPPCPPSYCKPRC